MKLVFLMLIVLLAELILTMIAMKKNAALLLRDVNYVTFFTAYTIVLYQVDLSGYGPLFGIRSEVWTSILLIIVALAGMYLTDLLIHLKEKKSENEFLSLIATYLSEQRITVNTDSDIPSGKEGAAAVIEAIEKGDMVRIELICNLQKTE